MRATKVGDRFCVECPLCGAQTTVKLVTDGTTWKLLGRCACRYDVRLELTDEDVNELLAAPGPITVGYR